MSRRTANPWTEAELDALFEGAENNLSAGEIAKKMKTRDRQQVVNKAYQLKLPLRNKNSRLTVDQVKEIRKSGDTYAKLGKKYGVSAVAIHNVKHGITYGYVDFEGDEG